jgi:hypothetical protein
MRPSFLMFGLIVASSKDAAARWRARRARDLGDERLTKQRSGCCERVGDTPHNCASEDEIKKRDSVLAPQQSREEFHTRHLIK